MISSSIFDTITPADLGLPPKFKSYRQPQREALEWLHESANVLSGACLPTGIGKTALAISFAKLLGVRCVYLVATKALMTQALDDLNGMGIVDIKGRANYPCPSYRNCDDGADEDCELRQKGQCPYVIRYGAALGSEIVVTNYAYWLWSRKFNKTALGEVGLLICDEAHTLEGQLSSFAAVKLYASELGVDAGEWSRDGVMSEADPENWSGWCKNKAEKLKGTQDDDEKDFRDRLLRVAAITSSNWAWQFDSRGHVAFEPIRLNSLITRLFSDVPRVLMMSASLTEFQIRLLVPDGFASYDYRSWPPVFNSARAPVYHIPTRKLSWKSTDEDYETIIAAADEIADQRTDRKGVWQTVSYARARRILAHSRHAGRFIWNDSASDLPRALDHYRRAGAGAIFVSPSVEEAFDFPADQCRYSIVIKFPFPNETQRVIKERCQQIPGYRLHYAAQKIVQMRGRPIRDYDDWSEMFVLDNSVSQLNTRQGQSYTPPGFRIFTVAQAPAPPPLTRV